MRTPASDVEFKNPRYVAPLRLERVSVWVDERAERAEQTATESQITVPGFVFAVTECVLTEPSAIEGDKGGRL